MLDEAFWIIFCDMLFGCVQWLLVLRFIYGIFLPENSRLFGVRQNNKATDPIIKAFGVMTHGLIILRVRPLYVAFYFLFFRFYALPTFIGYDINKISDLSLEAYMLMALGALGLLS